MAATDVVDAAETMHLSDNQLLDLSWASDAPASDTEFNIFEEKREQNRQAKEHMLRAARATLGLDPAAVIADQYWGRSPGEQEQ